MSDAKGSYEPDNTQEKRVFVAPGKDIGDRLVVYSEKLGIFVRYLEAIQDAIPPQEPAMFWFDPIKGLNVVVNVPSEFRYHILHFDVSFFTAYRCISSGFRVIITLHGFLMALGRLDKAAKSRCFTLMDTPDNTLTLSGSDDRTPDKQRWKAFDKDTLIQELIKQQKQEQTTGSMSSSIVPRDQFVGPSQFAFPCEKPKALHSYPMTFLIRPDWLHAVLKRVERGSSEIILEFDRFRQVFGVRFTVDGKTSVERTAITDDRILPNPFFHSTLQQQHSKSKRKSTVVFGQSNGIDYDHSIPVSEGIDGPQNTKEWIEYYKQMSCNVQCSMKSIWVAIKRLTRCSPYIRLYMAHDEPLVIEHVLDGTKDGMKSNTTHQTSSYMTWIHPIHDVLQKDLIPSEAELEHIVEDMLKRRSVVPAETVASELVVQSMKDRQAFREQKTLSDQQTSDEKHAMIVLASQTQNNTKVLKTEAKEKEKEKSKRKSIKTESKEHPGTPPAKRKRGRPTKIAKHNPSA